MTDRLHPLDEWRTPYDAVIVGGGPAGLSAALVLGRARKRVLVVDNDRPANAVSQGVGGLLGHDRVKPADLRRRGQRQLQEHPNVEFRHGAVEDAERIGDVFVVQTTDGSPVRAHAIVLAHGLRYDPPQLPGIEPLWGRSVFHCAFCDGWEVRNRPLAFHGAARAPWLRAHPRGLEQRRRAVHRRRARSGGARWRRGRALRTEPIAQLPGATARLSGSSSRMARPSGAKRCS